MAFSLHLFHVHGAGSANLETESEPPERETHPSSTATRIIHGMDSGRSAIGTTSLSRDLSASIELTQAQSGTASHHLTHAMPN